jgi:hypothetical protein
VSPHLRGDGHQVQLRFVAQLLDAEGRVEDALDLREGDGMCTGYHGGRDGDFGTAPILVATEPR